MLHIHCGDIAADVARRATLPGEVIGWKDSAAVGPSSADPVEHVRLRGEFWGDLFVGQSLQAVVSNRDCVLWFGPDPWEQVALVEVLARVAGHLSLAIVPLDRAVGLTAPDALPALLDLRRDAQPLIAPAIELWNAFAEDDRAGLRDQIERLAHDTRLPHLSRALKRVLQDREAGRTETQIRDLVRSGKADRDSLMRALAALEDPDHGAWYGDGIVMKTAAKFIGR